MLWSYYGTGHGKREWDGAGAVVKKALRSEQLLNPHRLLQNALHCVTFLNATMAGQVPTRRGGIRYLYACIASFFFTSHAHDVPSCMIAASIRILRPQFGCSCCFFSPCKWETCRSYRYFHHIGVNDVDRTNPEACDRLPGSSKVHSILAPDEQDPTKLLLRSLSCFCGPCVEEDYVHCENRSYVRPWNVVKIQPRNVQFARAQMIHEEGSHSWDYEYEMKAWLI
jgi:hypothetical protein